MIVGINLYAICMGKSLSEQKVGFSWLRYKLQICASEEVEKVSRTPIRDLFNGGLESTRPKKGAQIEHLFNI